MQSFSLPNKQPSVVGRAFSSLIAGHHHLCHAPIASKESCLRRHPSPETSCVLWRGTSESWRALLHKTQASPQVSEPWAKISRKLLCHKLPLYLVALALSLCLSFWFPSHVLPPCWTRCPTSQACSPAILAPACISPLQTPLALVGRFQSPRPRSLDEVLEKVSFPSYEVQMPPCSALEGLAAVGHVSARLGGQSLEDLLRLHAKTWCKKYNVKAKHERNICTLSQCIRNVRKI